MLTITHVDSINTCCLLAFLLITSFTIIVCHHPLTQLHHPNHHTSWFKMRYTPFPFFNNFNENHETGMNLHFQTHTHTNPLYEHIQSVVTYHHELKGKFHKRFLFLLFVFPWMIIYPIKVLHFWAGSEMPIYFQNTYPNAG